MRMAEKILSDGFDFLDFKKRMSWGCLLSGIGTIGLSLADRVQQVYGVEVIPEAVENSQRNAELNGITNASYVCALCRKSHPNLAESGNQADVILVDPPRKGLTESFIPLLVSEWNPSGLSIFLAILPLWRV